MSRGVDFPFKPFTKTWAGAAVGVAVACEGQVVPGMHVVAWAAGATGGRACIGWWQRRERARERERE
jgi:hypothetical protein